MPFPGLPPEDTRKALYELDQALSSHEHWCDDLYRTLICALPPDERDLARDAHKHCRFGRWLYGAGAALLSTRPAFATIERAHERIHSLSGEMLGVVSAGGRAPLGLYERFANSLSRMRLEILTAKRELEDCLYNLDPLSGAATRYGMLARLRAQQALVMRRVQSCAVAMMDFDHFKEVNDIYGHAAGDKVIAEVSRRIMTRLRPYDILFRYGGEEFLICLPDTDLEEGRDMLERLRKEIAAMRFDDGHGRSFQVTVSFGLVSLDPDVSVKQSIERADRAMYAAKASGRNCVTVWDSAMENASGPAQEAGGAAPPGTNSIMQ